ncbi:MAG: ATP-binding protein [Actinobacteria bacterium]|nr:ATP-binding protein [Actinomycetota bacterium]
MPSALDRSLQPTTRSMGNLRRTTDGSIWADYQMTGLAYGFTSEKDKYQTLVHHKNLFHKLPNNSLIKAPVAAMCPDRIMAAAMADGVDPSTHPSWRQECEGKHAHFATQGQATERIFTLSFPVTAPEVSDGLGGARRSRERDRQEMVRAFQQAADIVAKLPSVFDFRPLTTAQKVWLWDQALSRSEMTEVFPDAVTSNVSAPAGAFGVAQFDEGLRVGTERKWLPGSFAQMVHITRPGRVGATESYQTLMTIESLPADGMLFPGAEFFTIADRIERRRKIGGREVKFLVNVDWAVRINKVPREQAVTNINKKLKRLTEQLGERDAEISFAQDVLFDQRDDLAEYVGLLEKNDSEIAVLLTPFFAVGSSSRTECEHNALALAQGFENKRIKLVAPPGGQREAWAAMNPGGHNLKIVSDYAHETISEHAAACVPCTTNVVGDDTGPIFAENLSSRRRQPVHLAWWREAIKDASPSVAFCGELGAGKTWAILTLLFALIDNGGQYLAIDRTDQGEYDNPSKTLGRHVIVDLYSPQWSMDPLRIFSADIGVEKAVELLLPLFGCPPDSPMGLTLGELLHPQHGLRSIPEMLSVLQRGVDEGRMSDGRALPMGWSELCRALSFWSTRRYASALMDINLPPMDLNAQGIVIRTNRVEVPTQEEIKSAEPLDPSKVFGRAIYGLAAEIGRQAFGNNKNRVGAVVMDEAYHVTSSPRGLAAVTRIIRDGRKDNTSLILGSHDPVNDYPTNTALDLIPIRIAMRHRSEPLARRSLNWLGIDPDKSQHILNGLMTSRSPKGADNRVIPGREGEGYLKDARGRIGRIKVLGPSSQHRRLAMTTTPPEQRDNVA